MKIKNILNKQDLDGFTVYLGDKKGRYIVGVTMNDNITNVELEKQYQVFKQYKNLTFGGRVDKKTSKRFLDFGLAINDLNEAKTIGKTFGQIAIRDNEKMEEIIL